jgi:quercetin dioxygenase-like cupin family protein
MTILRASQRPTRKQPAAHFTGEVFSDEIVTGKNPSRMRASVVSFTPGARTAWHSHPVGQTLYCLSGAGRVQFEGASVQELRPDDTVLTPFSHSIGRGRHIQS